MSEGVETAYIRVSRVLTEDDDQIGLEASDGLSMVEGLGLLELAKDTWLRTNALHDEEE